MSARALASMALPGWKASVRPMDETADVVVILTSPDFDPTAQPPVGRLFAGRAADECAAACLAIDKATKALQL
jgi:hypothetical protein